MNNGLKGLSKKHEHYNAEFKLSVLRRMKKGRLSYREVEAMFNLRGCGMVSRWERLYHEGGVEALKPKPKGRPKMIKPSLPPVPPLTNLGTLGRCCDSKIPESLVDICSHPT
ncbi:helix-turn-helix domain-containing protein [Herbaspirillum sp. RV1423]|uniref:helix-turn-helix domain-containing protein n=1 Tax=Herbaspirillum sp. RV1423 TaxID=1443993 RepID=UPI0009DD25BB